MDESMKKKLDEMHTMTIFYLAQVYGYLKNAALSAKYCSLTLMGQLASKQQFDKVVCIYYYTLNLRLLGMGNQLYAYEQLLFGRR
jgi:hypothetical protein